MKEYAITIPATLRLKIRAKSSAGVRVKLSHMPSAIFIDYRDLPVGFDATVETTGRASVKCLGEVHTGLSYTVDRFCSRKGA